MQLIYRLVRYSLCAFLTIKNRNFFPSKKQAVICLTFDDGPHPVHTKELLTLLNAFNAKATFFVSGDQLEKHLDIGQLLVSQGHVLGNHTYSHALLVDLDQAACQNEIKKCQNIIDSVTGCNCRKLFRPPRGLLPFMGVFWLMARKYHIVLWTVDSFDSHRWKGQQAVESLKQRVKPNAIVLFHDDCEIAYDALVELLPWWKAQNYEFRTL